MTTEKIAPNYYPENHQPMRVQGFTNFSPNCERFDVLDQITGKRFRMRRASCGLGCKCAAAVVKELSK